MDRISSLSALRYASNDTETGEYNDLGVFTTDENGRIELTGPANGLRDGWFRVKELEPPTGFSIKDSDKSSVKHIADALAKKYEAKLAEELEKYKSELLKSEYVTKQFFDVQLEIYRNLNRKLFQAFVSVNQVAPMGKVRVSSDPDEQAERRKQQIETAYQNCVEAQFALKEINTSPGSTSYFFAYSPLYLLA